MTPLQRILCMLLLLASQGAEMHAGYAPHYSPKLMARVARNRHMSIVDCMISSPRYPLGTWVYVVGLNTERVELCRVTDVSALVDTTGRGSAESDRDRHLRTKREAELSYEAALRLCGKKAIRDRPEACPIIIIRPEVKE